LRAAHGGHVTARPRADDRYVELFVRQFFLLKRRDE
jgi:hypothetical protein